MRKLLSTAYSDGAFNFALLVQRVVTGLLLLIGHGFQKFQNFTSLRSSFYDPLRIGHRLFTDPGNPGRVILFNVYRTGIIHPYRRIYYRDQFIRGRIYLPPWQPLKMLNLVPFI